MISKVLKSSASLSDTRVYGCFTTLLSSSLKVTLGISNLYGRDSARHKCDAEEKDRKPPMLFNATF